jgi:hypothetical protein
MSQPENQMGQQPPAYPEYGAPIGQPTTAEPEEPARLNWLQRLTNILFSPGDTFEDINRKPTILVPIIILMALTMSTLYFINWRVKPDIAKITREQMIRAMEKFGQPKPTDEQIADAVERQKKINKYQPIIAAAITPIIYLIVTGIFAAGLIMLQAKTTFKKVLSVVTWSNAAIGIVSFLVLVAALMVKDEESLRSMDIRNIQSAIPTNPAAFMGPETSSFLRGLAASLDVFSIWLIVLTIIGFTALAGKKKKGSIKWMVIGIWVVWAVVKAGFAGVFGA